MSDPLDQYETPAAIVAPGENSIAIDSEGNVSVKRRAPDERPNIWKGAKKIAALSDDCIREYPPRPRSGIVDYRIDDVSVSWRGGEFGEKRAYLCHTCVVNDCPHTRRIARYREEHPSPAAEQTPMENAK